jgi:LysM domain
MASLTAHLVETGDHGRLGFHPNCPVCRQDRLFGSLSSGPVVSRRTQAALATGVIAFSTAAPGAALAQEPDNQSEGTAAPEQPSVGEVDSPGFDPGGETALPFETGAAPATPQAPGDSGPEESMPLETEPTMDPDARFVPDTEPEVPVAGPDEPVPSPEVDLTGDAPTLLGHRPESAPLTPPVGQPEEVPSSSSPSQEREHTSESTRPGQTQKSRDTEAPSTPPNRSWERSSSEGSPAPGRRSAGQPSDSPAPPSHYPTQASGSPTAPAAPPQSVSSTIAAVEQPVLVAEAGTSGTSARDSLSAEARFHVVAPGDSLWSIAKRLLGSDASPALVAREVNRLWTLNRDRIGTGDPDLLMVGTKLRLR